MPHPAVEDCPVCQDLAPRRYEGALREAQRQLQACARCGWAYMFHLVQHPHPLEPMTQGARCAGFVRAPLGGCCNPLCPRLTLTATAPCSAACAEELPC